MKHVWLHCIDRLKVTPLVYAIYFATIDFTKKNPHYAFVYTNYYLKCVYLKNRRIFFKAANKVGTPHLHWYIFICLKCYTFCCNKGKQSCHSIHASLYCYFCWAIIICCVFKVQQTHWPYKMTPCKSH